MIFHFFFTHVGRSLLEGLQRSNWLSVHSHYFYLHVDLGKQSGADAGSGNIQIASDVSMLHSKDCEGGAAQ